MGVGEDAGDVDALVVEAAHGGGDVGPGRGGEDRVPDQALGEGGAQEVVGPPAGAVALGLRAGGVTGDGALDSCGHGGEVREECCEVDAGAAEGDEPAGGHGPVGGVGEVVEERGGQVLAELVGGPPGLRHLPDVLRQVLFLAVVVFLGGAADRVRDREDQPDRHRRGLRGFGEGFGERLARQLGRRGSGHRRGSFVVVSANAPDPERAPERARAGVLGAVRWGVGSVLR
ncbi:hypothetical protein [Streptomyces griseus]|uniref:hypothetical protein n=1 Tax=Streptomyces griseus TaxID=1911 RepID=UPI0036AED170